MTGPTYRTNIEISCTCGEKLYGRGSYTNFTEHPDGTLDVSIFIAPCPRCSGSKSHSSATKVVDHGDFRTELKVGG